MTFRKITQIRKIWEPFNKIEDPIPKIKAPEKIQDPADDFIKGLVEPKIISYYADFDDKGYYQGFAKLLIEKCEKFGLNYDISELPSRGNYGVNCLMKPEFILSKLIQYKEPLIWIDCDTDFKEPFEHFNNVTEDIGMATHSGNMEGIKASPLYFNYTKGAFSIIREWVVHCRACYDKNIVELDHDALKHYVLEAVRGSYSVYLLTDNWNDFVSGRYIWNGNSRVDGKIQIHRKVGVNDDVRMAYSQDVKYIKLFFTSETENAFESALKFLEKFSNRSRISFNFPPALDQFEENPNRKRLEIESGGSVYFEDLSIDTFTPGKTDIVISIKDVNDIEEEWDLKILSMVDGEINPLYNLNFNDNGKGEIKIKTFKKLWI
jgi:hypothetical protein